METSHESNLLAQPDLIPLEQEVLEEYEKLAENMKRVCPYAHMFWFYLLPRLSYWSCVFPS